MGACESFADDRLATSIWNQGAKAILGNTRSVQITYNFKMLHSFAEGLTKRDSAGNYYTITQALEYAKDKNGERDSTIVAYGSEVLMAYREGADVSILDFFSIHSLGKWYQPITFLFLR